MRLAIVVLGFLALVGQSHAASIELHNPDYPLWGCLTLAADEPTSFLVLLGPAHDGCEAAAFHVPPEDGARNLMIPQATLQRPSQYRDRLTGHKARGADAPDTQRHGRRPRRVSILHRWRIELISFVWTAASHERPSTALMNTVPSGAISNDARKRMRRLHEGASVLGSVLIVVC